MNITAYFLDLMLHLEALRNPETAVNRWAAEFNRARAVFRYDDCQVLLSDVKALSEGLPGEAQAIIWHCQGGLLHQLQQWESAIDRYQRSQAAFEMAGNLGQSQVLSDLGNIYQALGQWQRATQCLSEALPLKRQFARPSDLAATINNLAVNRCRFG